MENPKDMLKEYILEISNQLNANLFIFSASINNNNVDEFIKAVRYVDEKRDNVALFLTTYGGDPNAAYRIARYLKGEYKKLILFVFGYCKSAGTLLALGADEIVISDFGELGPLDIQISKEDDLFRQGSGLDIQQSLTTIEAQAYDFFADYLIKIIASSQALITTKTAADIASSMAVGLLAPIVSQIDPLKLGEMNRSMQIASAYGQRLNPDAEETIEQLTTDYPSHSFVIDYEEAKKLFTNVRKPEIIEYKLESINFLFDLLRTPNNCIGSLDLDMEEDYDSPENTTNQHGAEETDSEVAEKTTQADHETNQETEGNELLSH